MTNILVTGGAGYVGAHVCKALRDAGMVPVTFDNFSTGWRGSVRFGPLEAGDLRDRTAIARAFEKYRPKAVLHLAALSSIADSMREPKLYNDVNVAGSGNLLDTMADYDVANIVFSSTCAVYAENTGTSLAEDSALVPKSVYGQTKRATEEKLAACHACSGINYVSLRYFNVAGADADAGIGESHSPETHLIPLALRAATSGGRLQVHGDDYDTPDGTCVRDYIHVGDLAQAHLNGLAWLRQGNGPEIFNLGMGTGFSVLEVLRGVEKTLGAPVPYSVGERRNGDAGRLVCGSDKARRLLGWLPKLSGLERMIGDAWNWHRQSGFEF